MPSVYGWRHYINKQFVVAVYGLMFLDTPFVATRTTRTTRTTGATDRAHPPAPDDVNHKNGREYEGQYDERCDERNDGEHSESDSPELPGLEKFLDCLERPLDKALFSLWGILDGGLFRRITLKQHIAEAKKGFDRLIRCRDGHCRHRSRSK